jgi:hypothetical protein
MHKYEYQIANFLKQSTFKSEMDWKFISSFCQVELNLNLDVNPKYAPDGLDSSLFSSWYENGFGSGDIVWAKDKLVILGACTLTTAKIESTLIDDKINKERSETAISELSKASDDDISKFKRALSIQEFQFHEDKQLVAERKVPVINERISFHKPGVRGIGVIKSISPEEDYFELYCYHIYQTDETKYSMSEIIKPLSEYTFQSMTAYERRRLENKLNKLGKTWYGKVHRIEPEIVKVKNGKKYWYITDKIKMTSAIEKGLATSNSRYLGGNYFSNAEDCLDNLAKINELLRNFLAK